MVTALTYEEIGKKLKNARIACGLTQEQSGEYLGVSREMISYYETGKREIDMIKLGQLADLYGYSLSYFVTSEETTPAVMISFRMKDLTAADLEVIAWAKRFVENLSLLNELLEGQNEK